jgi:hypothetical protein
VGVRSAIADAASPGGCATEPRHFVLGLEREGPAATLRIEAFDKRYGDYRSFGNGPEIVDGRTTRTPFDVTHSATAFGTAPPRRPMARRSPADSRTTRAWICG